MTGRTRRKLVSPFEGEILLRERLPIDAGDYAYSPEEAQRAFDRLAKWRDYGVTPLYRLDGAAAELGFRALYCKDESHRLGMASFKAMGAVYASVARVTEVVERMTGQKVCDQELLEGEHRTNLLQYYLTCCTDGNHGFSVAWAARLMGMRCRIYIPRGVSAAREAALRDQGAEVVRIDGTYDEAYDLAAKHAEADPGALVISDSATPNYTQIPRLVMSGYSVMVREILEQVGKDLPTHVILPAGCGGLAGAVMTAFDQMTGAESPIPIVVEPLNADCVFSSLAAGHEVEVEGDLETIMGGLSCAAVSHVAWPVLHRRTSACLRIEDQAACQAMRLLANPRGNDPAVVAGETGAAGMAGAIALANDDEARTALRLDDTACILVFNCEGATDPGAFREIVGAERSDELGVNEL